MLAGDGQSRACTLGREKRENPVELVNVRAATSGPGVQEGIRTRGSDQPNSTSEREAHSGLHDHHSRQEKRLTDGWNYVKVVVGSNLRVEVQMKSSHSVWAKHREGSEVIDLDGLFSKYWSSDNREFTVLSQ